MQQIKFLYGNNLSKETPFTAGTVYLDLATGELYFDAPNAEAGDHAKVIDSATLIYTITESISFPSSGGEDSGSTSAKLGVAVLGSMKLGME